MWCFPIHLRLDQFFSPTFFFFGGDDILGAGVLGGIDCTCKKINAFYCSESGTRILHSTLRLRSNGELFQHGFLEEEVLIETWKKWERGMRGS